jgi:hypothetical protein
MILYINTVTLQDLLLQLFQISMHVNKKCDKLIEIEESRIEKIEDMLLKL